MKEFFKENIVQVLFLVFISLTLVFGFQIMSAKIFDAVSFENVENINDRVRCAETLGWNVDKGSETVRTVYIPTEMTEEMRNYNEMQKMCGFDLTDYMGKSVKVYTYRILNFPSTSPVNAFLNLIICNEKLIGGDCIVDEYDDLYLPLIKPDTHITAGK